MDRPEPRLLEPRLQRYDWGDPRFIPDLLGLDGHEGPCAEAWFGAHPRAPARVVGADVPLDAFLEERREEWLGPRLAREHASLPYLLKLLAAARPLSIQAHPNRDQARAGFAREEEAGIPRDAPDRCYRDPNHKPEIMLALTDFHALCGFRRGEDLVRALESARELTALVPGEPPRTPAALRAMLEAWFALPEGAVVPALDALLGRLEAEDARSPHSDDTPEHWALEARRQLFGDGTPDRGLLFVFLLEHLRLSPGQALFLPAGVPHAYLRGAGVELMASSDNVLRAGLTSKHVDAAELLEIVRFDAGRPPVLEAVEDASGTEAVYPVPASELELRRLRVDGERTVVRDAYGPETWLALPADDGAGVRLGAGGTTLTLRRGEACLVPHGARVTLEADGVAEVVVAGSPRPPEARTTPGFRGRRPVELAFGTSGLRGLVSDITDLEAWINTRGFLDVLVDSGDAVPGTRVALGGDLRPSTGRILRAVAGAVRDAGLEVVHCGRLPTPALACHAFREGWPSVMVTGSHIPFDRNGIKFNRSGGEVLKEHEAPILAAVARVRAREYARAPADSPFDDAGAFRPGRAPELPAPGEAAGTRYRRRYLDAFPADALEGLRIAFYEHSAVGRDLLPDLLEDLGAEVVRVGRSETFIPIDTEAISAERLAELQALADAVRAEHGSLDALVSTDGDSDRPMLLGVDEAGGVRFFGGDVLGAVVAEYVGADAIVVPVSANDAIDRHFEPRGVPVVRTRIGSPWVIAEMARLDAERIVGWEANGGFLVGSRLELDGGPLEPLPTRDAALPVLAALHAARRDGLSLVELFGRLPARFGRAALLDQVPRPRSLAVLEAFGPGDPALRGVRWEEDRVVVVPREGPERAATGSEAARLHALRRRLAAHLAQAGLGEPRALDALDGLRLSVAGGEVAHVRPSGNAPQLRIYATADTPERAEAIVEEGVREPDGLLRTLLAAAEGETGTAEA